MPGIQRVSGDRSHLSPVYGKFAPKGARITETTDIIDKLDAVLAAGDKVEHRTDKVFGLWEKKGARQAEKSEDVIAAATTMNSVQARVESNNRVAAFFAGVLTTVVIGISAWLVFG